jgi:outer membrane protein
LPTSKASAAWTWPRPSWTLRTQDLLVRVSQAYFDVLAAQDTLTFVQAQKAAVSEQLAAAKRNFEVGTATITDTREAQARYDLVTAQEIAAENDLRVKKLALDQLVGIQGTKPLPAGPARAAARGAARQRGPPGCKPPSDQQPGVRQAALALDVARLETAKSRDRPPAHAWTCRPATASRATPTAR